MLGWSTRRRTLAGPLATAAALGGTPVRTTFCHSGTRVCLQPSACRTRRGCAQRRCLAHTINNQPSPSRQTMAGATSDAFFSDLISLPFPSAVHPTLLSVCMYKQPSASSPNVKPYPGCLSVRLTHVRRSWSPLRVITGYLQQSPSLVVHQPSGLLLCVFGHKDGWPINNTQVKDGWRVVGGQRFIASLDGCVQFKPLATWLRLCLGIATNSDHCYVLLEHSPSWASPRYSSSNSTSMKRRNVVADCV